MIKKTKCFPAALAGFCAVSVFFVLAPGLARASTVPSAPTSPVATPGIAGASVSFTPPVSDGGSAIIRYTVTSSPGGIIAIGGAPPIAVSGLTNGTSYTFTVTATNINGLSAASGASNTVVPAAALAPWYNALWTKRKTIAVAGSTAGAQTNYPVKVTVPYASGMKADFSDLRFTDSSGTALLSYWMETEADSSTAVVWVKVPSVPIAPNATSIYAYYGNPAAVSLSNGDTTFTLFDTFGGGGTHGDWNYTNNIIGEHAIIHNGKLYAPLYDSDHGANGGLVVLNPVTGSVIKHFTIPGLCTAAAPAFDKNGYLHIYDCVGFIKKLDENTGTVLRTLSIESALDWEALAYDPVNDIILIASQNDHSLSAVRASDYSIAWRNTDVNLTYGSSEIDPPLILGAYVYWQDYSGVLYKISLSTGITAAFTNATAAGLPATPYTFSSYSQIIYDSANNRLYLTNSTGHTAFAINPADLSVVWSKVVETDGWNFNRGGAYHNNVWYVTARETGYPYRSKIYALNTQNNGNVLWTNTTAYDNGAEVSSLLADYNYLYAGTYDYSDQDYNNLLILNALDGTVVSTIPLLNGVASSIPTFYGGKIIMGLWYDTSGQQVGGYQALQVRDGGGTDDFYYKADLYQTGYVGAFASGPLTTRTGCGYGSLDPTKWIASGLSSISDCTAASTVNVSAWANSFKSSLTFSRSNTAIRARAKNSEPSSSSWDTYLGFTNIMGTCHPVCFGRNNGQAIFAYDQNGAPQSIFGPAYSFDQYSTAEVKMAYPSIQFDVNDSNIMGSTNWSTSFDQMPIQLGNFKGTATVDWVLIRNYVNPEPAGSMGVETVLVQPPVLAISKAHSGSFTQGQSNAVYTVTVSNQASAGPTSGTVTVTETVPTGMTLVSMAGTGWTCPVGGTTCNRSDVLSPGGSYPAITVTVNVAASASSPQVNAASVSGGGSASANTTDSTIINTLQPFRIGTYNTGLWHLDVNGNGTFDSGTDRNFFLGWAGATMVIGDWNGDGKTKAGVYSNGYWFLDYDGNGVWDGGVNDKLVAWGWAGATPVVGDWNGDGKTKIGVYSNGFWFLDYNGDFAWDGGVVDKQVGWGWAGVTPIVGDWNGDGKTKIGVYVNGFWFLDYNGDYVWDGGVVDKQVGWGWAGVTPIVGDWNGDGKTKIGVYSGGYWYLDYDGNYLWEYPARDKIWALGWTGTTPVMGDWNGDGKTKAGAFINGYWYLDYNGNGVFDGAGTDRIFAFGASGDTPVVGRW